MQEKIDDANKSKEEIQAEIEKINGAIDRLTAMLNNI
jgi:peptidoglycan hydrolase CwlO-like protein